MPQGNRDDWDAPHGVYHCQGDDRWIAIAVTNDAEWQALCRAIDRSDLVADPRLVTAAGRRQYQDELDAVITAWTRRHQDYEAMHLFASSWRASRTSADIARVYHDPQLRAGGYLTLPANQRWRDTPVARSALALRLVWSRHTSPLLRFWEQDNTYVYSAVARAVRGRDCPPDRGTGDLLRAAHQHYSCGFHPMSSSETSSP
jgi:crotonobetainyl-CoA:carnitine CoA-transferase CaiB-like acyl-CoA transferase